VRARGGQWCSKNRMRYYARTDVCYDREVSRVSRRDIMMLEASHLNQSQSNPRVFAIPILA
jgi:hypothetical protein